MRFHRLIVGCLTVTAAAGCAGDPTGNPINQTLPPLAFVRYFNAVGDTLPLDFRPIDQIDFSTPFLAVPFRAIGLGNYQGYEAGPRKIRVFPNSTDITTASSILVDTTLTLTAGIYYSIYHIGYARTTLQPRQTLWLQEDTLPAPGANIAVRVVHVGADLVGGLDIYATATTTAALPATPLFAGVTFKSRTAYAQMLPGALVLRAYAAGDRATQLFATTVQAGTAGTTTINPVAGANQAGSVLTAMVYSRAVAGSTAAVTAGAGVNTTPKIVVWFDKAPPATAP